MSEQHAFSRRSFLKGGAVGALSVAAASTVTGCGGTPTQSTSTSSSDTESSWKTAPEEVADSEITNTYDCDVVVVGMGYAGVTAFRELCEEGYNVILVEKQQEDSFAATGNEFASLNAQVLQDRGVSHIDPVEFFQNWVKITGNAVNQDLVMKFAQNSEANSNWYLDQCTEEDLATMTTSFFPATEHQMSELSGIKFWASTCSFYGDCNETKLVTYNRKAGEAAGGEVHWNEEGYYVVMEDGEVAGLVTKTDSGYSKYTAKAVVLATGGFGGNPDMMRDLMPDAYSSLVGDEQLSSMSTNDGAGVRMAYWAGAHLETTPVPGMNFRGLSVPGKMNCLPQAVWINENGKRFCNEYYPTSEQRGLTTVVNARKTKFAVCDDNFTTYRQYTLPQHAGFEASEENIQSLRDSLDTAYAKFQGTYEESSSEETSSDTSGPVTTVEYIADDTLEGLGEQMGFSGETLDNFLEQIAQWNQYCADGADQQYGRASEVLFPVDTPPYYACSYDPEFGETMVTCGGIMTDGEQNALDQNFEPIPGLYVSGNDCGRRFGTEYITPIPGCSLAMAIVLGRECGKSVGQYLAS
jgi:fumarate reductase flavoprotein subunit